MADAASVAGWPAFVARPYVCGALGEIDAGALEWAAWAAILRLGCPLGDATPFAGVRRLSAASALVWSRSRRRLRVERRQHRAIAAARGEANAGDLLDAVRSAMEVCAGRASILPLSGGWDSRLLAAIASARGFEIEAWTT